MSQLILFVIFLGSLAGIIAILYRRIPLLLEVTGEQEQVDLKKIVVSNARNLISSDKMKALASEKVLQKALSKTRGVAKRTENQTGEWLEKLRQGSESRKEKFADSYWQQFRTKGKSPKGRKKS